jgi:flagellar hook-length control protein FliK
VNAQSLAAPSRAPVALQAPVLAMAQPIAVAFDSFIAAPLEPQASPLAATPRPAVATEPSDAAEAIAASLELSATVLTQTPSADKSPSLPPAAEVPVGDGAVPDNVCAMSPAISAPPPRCAADPAASGPPGSDSESHFQNNEETSPPKVDSAVPVVAQPVYAAAFFSTLQNLPFAPPPSSGKDTPLPASSDDPLREASTVKLGRAMDSVPTSTSIAGATFMDTGMAAVPVPGSAPAASTPADFPVDRHLDVARGDAWLDDLASDIAASAERGGSLKFALLPPALGRLDVEVTRGGEGIDLRLSTRNEAAHDVLAAAQPRLVEEIRAQGIRVIGAEVSAGGTSGRDDRTGARPRHFASPQIEAGPPAPADDLNPSRKTAADGRYA